MAITRQQIELEGCYQSPKTQQILQFKIKKKHLPYGCRDFSSCLYDESISYVNFDFIWMMSSSSGSQAKEPTA